MSEITPARQNIFEQETRYRAAVSEATKTKIGGSINFINERQYDQKAFFLNGPYRVAVNIGSTEAVDGLMPFLFPVELVGVWMFNLVSGSSSNTQLDVRRRTSPGGTSTSIFSTRPRITSAASNFAYVGRRLTDNSVLGGGTGMTAPVLSQTEFNAGDVLTLDIVSAMPGAENAGLILQLRPR